jgi:hypothetical protein
MMSWFAMAVLGASALLFASVLGAQELGRRLALRRAAAGGAPADASGAVDAAVFALLGLLIAFTFSGAAARFDERRALIVEETNDIGTAWLRIDVVPAEFQPALRNSFRRYLDARIAAYRALPDLEAARAQVNRANALQSDIWTGAVAAVRAPGAAPSAAMLLLPSLNEMFDITTTRLMATEMHPPAVIFGLLFALSLAAALLAGYGAAGAARRPWLHTLVFAAVIAVSVYVIVDLEFPRFGFIRVDDFDQALVALRATMGRP